MNTYTFSEVGSRIKMRVNSSMLISCSRDKVQLVMNPSTNTISVRTVIINYIIRINSDTVVVDGTTYTPGGQPAETVYDAILGILQSGYIPPPIQANNVFPYTFPFNLL